MKKILFLILFVLFICNQMELKSEELLKKKTDLKYYPEKRTEDKKDEDAFSYNAYFRVMGNNDLGHGSKTLGWWPLYGRLMNETPWFQLRLANKIKSPTVKSNGSATVVCRIEGSSFRNGDEADGNLDRFKITQFYIETKDVSLKHFVTQTGTLWYNMGYIGIYDMYVAQTFWEAVGFRAGMSYDNLNYFVGVGDSGYNITSERKKLYADASYNSIPTIGGLVKGNIGKIFDIDILKKLNAGLSGMFFYENSGADNPNSPHQTPGFSYADIIRGEAVEQYNIDNPDAENIPGAVPISSKYWEMTTWLGYGSKKLFGPIELKWNDLSFSFIKKAPEVATVNGDQIIYISEFTDERYEIMLVDESQWVIWPNYVDVNIAFVLGKSWDNDNTFRPDDSNREIFSVLMRTQYYITTEIHALLETVYAIEKSTVGLRYREHWDSIEENTDGLYDPDGLEWGDTDTKHTVQLKTGVIFNPNGRGIYNRPSIRLLFGAQYSNVHTAFGNSYNESLHRENYWNKTEDVHWHYSISLEAEHWFGT